MNIIRGCSRFILSLQAYCRSAGSVLNLSNAFFFAIGCLLVSPFIYAEDYFEPSALEPLGASTQQIDLSVFEKPGGQLPGVYLVDIYANDRLVDSTEMNFTFDDEEKLTPQIPLYLLRNMGVKISAFPSLNALPEAQVINNLGEHIPDASTRFDFNRQQLRFSIPQAALNQEARGYIDPSRWNDGVPALFTNYSFSGANRWGSGSGENKNSYYLNLRSGANFGPWRLRNYSTYNHSDRDGGKWDSISIYLQRDVKSIKSQLLIGDIYTDSDIFDSVAFRGVKLATDNSMLPDSQKGYAPVIRGIAQSNAQVSIKQNGYTIYQTYVAPGAFAIEDLYPTSNSGDLEVIIKEEDGRERHFVQPYSSVAIMQREGHLKYSFAAGKYRSNNRESRELNFGQITAIYGLPYNTTIYGGILAAPNYTALASGVGHSFGSWGSLSTDVIWAKSELADKSNDTGTSWRVQYSKNIEATNTSITIANYRYSTEGYYSFEEVNEESTSFVRNNDKKRNKFQVDIMQPMGKYGSLSFGGYRQDYWGGSNSETTLNSSYHLGYKGVNYSFSYAYSKENGGDSTDHLFAFSVQVPLSQRRNHTSWLNYNFNANRDGDINQLVGISGVAFEDRSLSYSVQQGYANRGVDGSGNLTANYRGTYGTVNVGYNYSKNQQQVNYGLQGGLLVHQGGVTLSQPFGETFALVNIPDTGGVAMLNHPGVKTDMFGYTVIPYVAPYRENSISIDPLSLSEDVDIDLTTQTVIPSQGAVALASFSSRIGRRVLMTLTYRDEPVPFGANVTHSGQDDKTYIVGADGQVYMSGVADEGEISVVWGRNAGQSCKGRFVLPEKIAGKAITKIDTVCQ